MSMSKFNKQAGIHYMDWSKVEMVFYPSANGQGTIHAVSHFSLPLKNETIMRNLNDEYFNASFCRSTYWQMRCFLAICRHHFGIHGPLIYNSTIIDKPLLIEKTLSPIQRLTDDISHETWFLRNIVVFETSEDIRNIFIRLWSDFQDNKLHAPTVEIDLEHCEVLYGDKSNTYCCRIQTVRDKIMTLREMMQWQIDRLNKPFQSALTYPKNILVSA